MNPLQTPVAKPQNASNPQNDTKPFVSKTHNPFNLTRSHYTTEQFGTYNPFRCIQVTPGDHLPLGVSFDVNSETLSAPLLSELHKKHDYFYIPMPAIMPHTWEYIIKTPSQGDDVPDDANCFISDYPSYLKLMLSHLTAFFGVASTGLTLEVLENYLRYAFLVESMTSSGSISSRLGYNYTAEFLLVSSNEELSLERVNIDTFFDVIFGVIMRDIYVQIEMPSKDESLYLTTAAESNLPLYRRVSPSVMISMLRIFRENFHIRETGGNYITNLRSLFASVTSAVVGNVWTSGPISTNTDAWRTFNLAPIVAYNLCCAQYFVNTKVDYIYNADLYRETMKSLLLNAGIITTDNMMFPYNGHSITYDVFSNHYMQQVFEKFNVTTAVIAQGTKLEQLQEFISLLSNIYSAQTSLYFSDYFTGARPTPIGIGDSEYTLTGNTIDMVMLARKQMLARYLYTVGRIGNDAQEQLNIISGSYSTPDFHFPQFIDSTDSLVTGFQVGNTTSEGQGNQVTRLDSGDNTFATTLDISQHGYVLCVSSFYMPRCYSKTKDRHFFQRNRFDLFNEMLQFGGDQVLYHTERNDVIVGTYGYHSSSEEYKQTFPQASGAFRDLLAPWAYVVDADTLYTSQSSEVDNISPYSIRVIPSEFDVFMLSMPYLSLGHNYHFIVKYSVNVIANRQMISSPDIF